MLFFHMLLAPVLLAKKVSRVRASTSSKIIERRYHDLSFVIRPLPVVKVASNTRACSKLEEQLPMKGWDGVSVVSHSCVTSSNCKSKKVEVS